MIDGASQEGRDKFDEILFRPPPGVKKDVMRELPEWQPGAAGADFLAQMGSRGGSRTSVRSPAQQGG